MIHEYFTLALYFVFAVAYGAHLVRIVKMGRHSFADELKRDRKIRSTCQAYREADFSFFFSVLVVAISTVVAIASIYSIVFNKPFKSVFIW